MHVDPKDVIILEGILVLEDERLRDLMDIKLYVSSCSAALQTADGSDLYNINPVPASRSNDL